MNESNGEARTTVFAGEYVATASAAAAAAITMQRALTADGITASFYCADARAPTTTHLIALL